MVNRFTLGLKKMTGYCALAVATLLGAGNAARATATTTFNYTGSVQTYVVPGGITSLHISVSGASGGNGDLGIGGGGGTTSATLAVTPGQTIYVYVGGQGDNSIDNGGGTTLGYNGGGAFAGADATFAGGGGGASDIRYPGTDLFSRVLVAGGGGGGGMNFAGGDGGGLTGASGLSDGTAAGGGTQTGGGTGENGTGNIGSPGVGGDINAAGNGGGGGGGYFGGGAGSDAQGGGGGGSSYAGDGTSSVSFTQGGNYGNGVVTITPIGTIIHAPTFTHGGTQSLVVCENSVATPINTLLQINDLDPGNLETWTVISGPSNGTVTVGPPATSLGGNLTPYGFSYTPAVGFSGTDLFTVQISDGTNTATTDIHVTVNSISPILGANTVCIGGTITLSNILGGGVWTSSIPAAALITASTGILTGVVASPVLISYTNTSGCTATLVVTVNANPAAIVGPSSICKGFSASYTDIAPGGLWVTSSSNITLDALGNVTANTPGIATISYQIPSGCASVRNITVSDLPAPITGPSNVCLGASVFLTDATPGGVSWTSHDTSIAKVTNSGVVTGGHSTGSTTITYSVSTGCYITTTVNTLPLPPGITGNTPVCAGSSFVLADPAGAGAWNSGSPSVATVGSDGTVTGVNGGTSTIYYIDGNGCKTSVTATVNAILPITGTLSTCAGWPTSLGDASPGGTWSSGTPAIATIGSTGVVTGVSAGTATISYTIASGCVRTAVVTVGAGLPPITGVPAVCQGATSNLTDAAGGGTWSSSNPSTVSVNVYGIVTGILTGSANITYTTSACRAVQLVTVNANPSNISGPIKVCTTYSIALTDLVAGGVWTGSNAFGTIDGGGNVTGIAAGSMIATYTLPTTGCFKNYTVTINTTPTPIGGVLTVCTGTVTHLTDATNPGLSWTSTTTSVATINASGNLTAISAGTTTITYLLNTGCYTTTVVTVNASPAAPAAITGPSTVSHAGPGINLADVTGGGVWTSGNPALMTVDATGHVTAIGISGSTNINYIVTNGAGCTAFATKVITATAAPHSHGTTTTTVGGVVNVADETIDGEWTSSDNNIATVDANGLVSAVAPGEVIITHTTSNGEANTTHIVVDALPMVANMFPNPNRGAFVVKGALGSTKDAVVTYEITNMLGQVVYSNNTIATGGIINEQVSLISFTSGMYLLNIKSGNETKVLHFVLQ